MSSEHPTLYKLGADHAESRALLLSRAAELRTLRWLLGKATDVPSQVEGEWLDEPELPEGDFPCGAQGFPVFSQRLKDVLCQAAPDAGAWIPVTVDGSPTRYELFLAEHLVDCLDEKRASSPQTGTLQIKLPKFLADAIPLELAAFRIPQSPTIPLWNSWAVRALLAAAPTGLATKVVWSADPQLQGDHAPIGHIW